MDNGAVQRQLLLLEKAHDKRLEETLLEPAQKYAIKHRRIRSPLENGSLPLVFQIPTNGHDTLQDLGQSFVQAWGDKPLTLPSALER